MTRAETLTTLFVEYARAMQEAQMFEGALQFVAAGELDVQRPEFLEDPYARTEWFFSRPIGWLQRQLKLPTELLQEIDELRKQRNRLAHGYLVGMAFYSSDETERTSSASTNSRFLEALPESTRRDLDMQLAAAQADVESERLAAIEELRALRVRFADCNSQLHVRWLAWFPHASSCEEVDGMLREYGGEQDHG